MKRLATQFLPFVALMFVGLISVPRTANPTPPPERHPRIHAAVDALRDARADLQAAAHDFCGHRAAALEDTQKALNQLQKALACDRR